MKKMEQDIIAKNEKFLYKTIAVISILIAISDMFGALDKISWIKDNLLKLVFLTIGLLLLIVTQIKNHLDQLNEHIENQLIENLILLKDKIDKNLNLIAGEQLEKILLRLVGALNSNRFELENIADYRYVYKNTLKNFAGSIIFATSIPSKNFFWGKGYWDDSLEEHITQFIENGGKMIRIFFYKSGDLDDSDVQSILRTQETIGVDVYTCNLANLPPNNDRFILVDSECRFGWEPKRDTGNNITSVLISTNTNINKEYLAHFRKLLSLSEKYVPKFIGLDPHKTITLNDITMEIERFHEFELNGWQKSYKGYDQFFGSLTTKIVDELLNITNVSDKSIMLDVATGPGYVIGKAIQKGVKNPVGIDFSYNMIQLAKKNVKNAVFQEGDAHKLDFKDNSFDVVTMNFGILHLKNPEIAIKEVYRVLKPNGKFAFTTWGVPNETESVGFSIVLKAIEAFGNNQIESIPNGPPFFKYSDIHFVKKQLETIGFRNFNLQIETYSWDLKTENDLFNAFYDGTARTGGLLREQSQKSKEQIKKYVALEAHKYKIAENVFKIPMTIHLYCGTKIK